MDVRLKVEIKLDSDSIFSSGFSVPGGDDISVYKDNNGLPYLKATTFKGLLRESVGNIIDWQGIDSGILEDLFGKEAYDFQKHHLQFTSFYLKDSSISRENLYSSRTFTTLEQGVAKEGSLRSAEVINKGIIFVGEVTCDVNNVELIKQGIQGIKWIGLRRNRGFGKVTIKVEEGKIETKNRKIEATKYLYYRFETALPLVITDIASSSGNHYGTKTYIPGAAIRGMVLNTIANNNAEFFKGNRVKLLETKFLNAVLCKKNYVAVPTIKGFYEDKEEKNLENVVINGEYESGKKRASLGNVCAIKGDKITYFKTDISTITRIKKNEGKENQIFSIEVIESNQEFEGYILLENEELAEEISKVFATDIWIGADKYQGFGKCSVQAIDAVQDIHYRKEYGYSNQAEISKELYMVAISSFTMLDEILEPCGIDEEELAKKLGVKTVSIKYCSTSTSLYSGFNRKWKARNSAITMYDEGSIFKVECSSIPNIEAIREIQEEGLGIRREEGFGQVLFMRNDIMQSISKKVAYSLNTDDQVKESRFRRNKIQWIWDNVETIRRLKISKSQLGEIQEICHRGKLDELYNFLKKRSDIDPRRKEKYKGIENFITTFIKQSFAESFGVEGDAEKLQILCELFDYSRKEWK